MHKMQKAQLRAVITIINGYGDEIKLLSKINRLNRIFHNVKFFICFRQAIEIKTETLKILI